MTFFYPKLAITSIKKNGRIYIPFIFSSSLMIMVTYIITFLAGNSVVANMRGGDSLSMILTLGKFVAFIFSGLLMIDTYSYVLKRRKKELGLYNILGMNKRNLVRINFCENVILAAITIVIGVGAGVILSKFFELALVNMTSGEVSYTVSADLGAIVGTAIYFVIVYFVLFISGAISIGRTKATDLLHSENFGDKPPKANWLLGIGGIVLLGFAYYMAVTINNPLAAIILFFEAVIMVIIATYMIFISGSVLICKIMQKNKSYYYKPDHFVSVSSMSYRMKRNGAGLASICILLTMVLVMISSTACLYFGAEDAITSSCPRDIGLYYSQYGMAPEPDKLSDTFCAVAEDVLAESGYTKSNEYYYYEYGFAGMIEGSEISLDDTLTNSMSLADFNRVTEIRILPQEVYNDNTGALVNLNPGEALIATTNINISSDTLTIDGRDFKLVGEADRSFIGEAGGGDISSVIILIVSDFDEIGEYYNETLDTTGRQVLIFRWIYNFDCDSNPDAHLGIGSAIKERMHEVEIDGKLLSINASSQEANRTDFFGTFGGLFFIGILLSIVFLIAAVLIIYYKQISEGFEDQGRFEIMQKVGMTDADIKKSIRSQMLTVFFLPIVFAVLHLMCAFPMIYQMLMIFSVNNLKLLIIVTAITVLIFAAFYTVAYLMTTKAYYNIVSKRK